MSLVAHQTTVTSTAKPRVEQKLQILRGLASLAVVWSHIGYYGYLDPAYKMVGFFVPYGSMRPLLFFMLSGYMVGLSNKTHISNWIDVKTFSQKRFVRLYPIYALAILLGFIVAAQSDPGMSLLIHLTFLQNMAGKVLFENGAVWSMNYEVFFYILFIILSFFRIEKHTLFLTGASIFTGLAILVSKTDAQVFLSYCFAIPFWLVGLYGAGRKFDNADYPTSFFAALAILVFCYPQLSLADTLLKRLHINLSEFDNMLYRVKLSDLQFIPLCFLLVCSFNNKRIPWLKTMLAIIYSLAFIRLIQLSYNNSGSPSNYFAGVLLVISALLILFPFRANISIFRKAIVTIGNISYPTYLIHYPLMIIFIRCVPFSGTLTTFTARLVLYFIVLLSFSYTLGNYYQKAVSKRLNEIL